MGLVPGSDETINMSSMVVALLPRSTDIGKDFTPSFVAANTLKWNEWKQLNDLGYLEKVIKTLLASRWESTNKV